MAHEVKVLNEISNYYIIGNIEAQLDPQFSHPEND